MTKSKLGLWLYRRKNTPAFIKKLIHLRWDYNGDRLEKMYRSINPGNIFSIPFGDNENVLFELPDEGDLISRDIIVQKRFFEQEYLTEIKKILINPTCIIDVGANIGNHTLFFNKSWPGVTVYSFEPEPDIFCNMVRNLEINGMPSEGCFNMAVGSRIGHGKIVYDGRIEKNVGASRFDYDIAGTINVISLDEFILDHPRENIDLVKIDVEGFELKVLEGMKEVIKKYNPFIWIEVLDNNKEAACDILPPLVEVGASRSSSLLAAA